MLIMIIFNHTCQVSLCSVCPQKSNGMFQTQIEKLSIICYLDYLYYCRINWLQGLNSNYFYKLNVALYSFILIYLRHTKSRNNITNTPVATSSFTPVHKMIKHFKMLFLYHSIIIFCFSPWHWQYIFSIFNFTFVTLCI